MQHQNGEFILELLFLEWPFLDQLFTDLPADTLRYSSTCKLHIAYIVGLPQMQQSQSEAASHCTAITCSLRQLYLQVGAQSGPLVTLHCELQVTGQGAGFCVRVAHSWHCIVSMPNYIISPN